ncbi:MULTISPECIES: septum site-determining protein Ssd [unclassified Streptomyces]|uniref:septum site-determining protein Ssd n=1 Tax=unclassified Streptomyces TaxID=2593676 RepID=UPI002DDBB9CF|nr:septum site-determining protein Ssd [Streptomyces sp. NBC_01775]WSB77661.1 septum formation initiator [Streptomyces sp. NBC_01775]WSS42928.1 septum formation initiator [Streptomyces sp. NBC_01187]
MAENILIVTEDEELLDDLLRLCAAAGAEAEVAHGAPASGVGWAAWGGAASWERAPLVLVGDDCAAAPGFGGHAGADGGVALRRPGVLLVGRDLDDSGVWERGARIGAEGVVMLPDAESWLTGRIADASEEMGRPALTVGVIGGRGGAGASTLACALAVTAARAGERTMLIDGDPLGGGLDVLLGGERAEGLRWPAFAESRGRVGGAALAESLPRLHDLSVLSWDRGESALIPADAMKSVLCAARRRGGVVVVDLPRQMDETVAEALVQLDLGLAVVPAELRAVAAAHRMVTRVQLVVRDLRAVVRTPGGPGGERGYGSGLDDEEVARLLGLPLAGELPWERGLLESVDRGLPPGCAKDGALARFCREFWARVLSGGEVAA